jgi:hypothetical protein
MFVFSSWQKSQIAIPQIGKLTQISKPKGKYIHWSTAWRFLTSCRRLIMSFLRVLGGSYTQIIRRFLLLFVRNMLLWFPKYRSLSKITWFSSMLESTASISLVLGLVSEQELESIHACFARFHQKHFVKDLSNPNWAPRSLQSISEFNSINCFWFAT